MPPPHREIILARPTASESLLLALLLFYSFTFRPRFAQELKKGPLRQNCTDLPASDSYRTPPPVGNPIRPRHTGKSYLRFPLVGNVYCALFYSFTLLLLDRQSPPADPC